MLFSVSYSCCWLCPAAKKKYIVKILSLRKGMELKNLSDQHELLQSETLVKF